jgi:transcriptional regulator with XRE-family HTH domain
MMEGGEKVLAVSAKFAQLIRAAKGNYTDKEIEELTKVSFATWRRMVSGGIPSEVVILQVAKGLGVDPEPLINAAREVKPNYDSSDLLIEALRLTSLSTSSRMKLMQLYHKLLEEEQNQHSQAA